MVPNVNLVVCYPVSMIYSLSSLHFQTSYVIYSNFSGGTKNIFSLWPLHSIAICDWYTNVYSCTMHVLFTTSIYRILGIDYLMLSSWSKIRHFGKQICPQGVFLSTSVDMKYCGLASVDLHFKEHIQNLLLSIVMKFLIVGSSAPFHLVFGILIFKTNICHFIKVFR